MTDRAGPVYAGGMKTGCLFSQIGYDARDAVRVVLRQTVPPSAGDVLRRGRDGVQVEVTWRGPLWGSWWGVADCGRLAPGFHAFVWCRAEGEDVGFDVEVGDDLLWKKTWEAVSIGQAERRMRLSKKHEGSPLGWYDAGVHWQEANAHTAYLQGLADVLHFRGAELDDSRRERLAAQLINGSDYLLLLQSMGRERGFGDGALVHQSFTLDGLLIPADAVKAAAALAHVAGVLSEAFPETHGRRAQAYRAAAQRSLDWFLETPRHKGLPCEPLAHGPGFPASLPHEFTTPDLTQALDAALRLGDARVFALARQVLARQISKSEARGGLYGDFRLFDRAPVTEKAWTHGFDPRGHGFNLGMTHGQNLIPLLRLLRAFPNHEDAGHWRSGLEAFAYGYFKPACEANPFHLMPLGFIPGEGLIHFAGLWHGCNAVYGQAAALALELAEAFSDVAFREIAVGNLQWVAGLNSGICAESLAPSAHMWSDDVPEDRYVPVSMINGIGRRWAGSWLNVRGAICNGFATGDQFQWDTAPVREADGPHSFTDEDWITHAGGWLSGVSRL